MDIRFSIKKEKQPTPVLRLDRVANEVRPQEKMYTIDEVSKALDDLSVEDLFESLVDSPEFEELLITKGYTKKDEESDLNGQLSMLEKEGSVEESIVKPAKEVKKAEAGDDNPTEAPAATDEADEDKDKDKDEEISKALSDLENMLDLLDPQEVEKGLRSAVGKWIKRWRGSDGRYRYQYANEKKGGDKKSQSESKSESRAETFERLLKSGLELSRDPDGPADKEKAKAHIKELYERAEKVIADASSGNISRKEAKKFQSAFSLLRSEALKNLAGGESAVENAIEKVDDVVDRMKE